MNILTESDLALINALQIAPRLPWTELSGVLALSPLTLSRRWDQLFSEGLAWMSARSRGMPHGTVVSIIDLECLPEHQNELVSTLSHDPRVVSLEEVVGSSQLQLTVMVPQLQDLTLFLSTTLGGLRGIRSKNGRIVTGVYKRGDEWRLDSLNPNQVRTLRSLSTDKVADARANTPRDPSSILNALEKDGRVGASEIARSTKRDASSIHRQINGLLRAGSLSFRCDLAQSFSGWPISCTWHAKVPHSEQDRAGATIRSLPRVRMCLSVTGETNLVFSIWARSIEEIPKLERLIESKIEHLSISNSSITLRTHKRMGWLLDEQGRSTGTLVPVLAYI